MEAATRAILSASTVEEAEEETCRAYSQNPSKKEKNMEKLRAWSRLSVSRAVTCLTTAGVIAVDGRNKITRIKK